MTVFALSTTKAERQLCSHDHISSSGMMHTPKVLFVVCLASGARQRARLLCASTLPCASSHVHDKDLVCRVPEKKHTTKPQAHDKLGVSGKDNIHWDMKN